MSVNGKKLTYDCENPNQLNQQSVEYESTAGDSVANFWRCINICHDCFLMNIKGKVTDGKQVQKLSGASLDEVTFLEMSKKVGYCEFTERQEKRIKINIKGNTEEYEILRVIEFDSLRKRMSVIVKNTETNKVFNFIKGADVALEERLSKDSKTSD